MNITSLSGEKNRDNALISTFAISPRHLQSSAATAGNGSHHLSFYHWDPDTPNVCAALANQGFFYHPTHSKGLLKPGETVFKMFPTAYKKIPANRIVPIVFHTNEKDKSHPGHFSMLNYLGATLETDDPVVVGDA